jgi:hypothetical protein
VEHGGDADARAKVAGSAAIVIVIIVSAAARNSRS